MMGSMKLSSSVLAIASKTLLSDTPNVFTQQIRTTVILRRMYPIALVKKGRQPPQMKHRQLIYEVVEDTNHKPKTPIDLILTQYIEGVGDVGDKVCYKPLKAYRDFLLPGLAVYATPENIQKFTNNSKLVKSYSSKRSPLTIKCLSAFCLMVNMSIDNPWTIEKWHIRASFRRAKVHVTDESITLPEKEIKGPNLDLENREFYVTITVNKTETVKVRCKLHHDTLDTSKQLEDNEIWRTPGKAIFEEDQEVLDSMPPVICDRKKNKTVI